MTQRILDGILNEIASSFVLLTPRNDEGILEFLVLEILGSSPRMTKKVRSGDDTRLRNYRIPCRDPQSSWGMT